MRAIAICLLLAACSAPVKPPPAARVIQWIKTPAQDIHKLCRGMSNAVLVMGRINGCSKVEKGVCTIYATDGSFSDKGRMEVLGHEFKHCFDGPRHDD